MKKNRIAVLSAAAALMMAVTACGNKAAQETTAPSQTSETTTAAETATTAQETSEATEEETQEAGALDADGKFTAASGNYVISVPKGWQIAPSSDSEITTFMSEGEDDLIEITCETEDISGVMEKMPATAEEYRQLITKGSEDLEVIDYSVTDDASGQTFQYAVKYNSEDADTKYTRTSGYYDTEKNVYVCARATVTSDGDEIIEAVNAAMDSFEINR